jgi:hypothetical protein
MFDGIENIEEENGLATKIKSYVDVSYIYAFLHNCKQGKQSTM